MKNNLKKTIGWASVIACFISFGLSNWYYGRGAVALLQEMYPFLSNEFFAFLAGGFIPFIIFEISVKMFLKPMRITLKINSDEAAIRLRIFFIAANIVCFALNFIYFASRILFVWGNILLNFIVLLVFFIGFLYYQCKKMDDKPKQGPFIIQTGTVFLLVFGVVTVIDLVLTAGVI